MVRDFINVMHKDNDRLDQEVCDTALLFFLRYMGLREKMRSMMGEYVNAMGKKSIASSHHFYFFKVAGRH